MVVPELPAAPAKPSSTSGAPAGDPAGSPSPPLPVSHTVFPAGSLIVDLAQPQGRIARAFLEPDAGFEPEFVKEQLRRRDLNEKKNPAERKEGYEFYDITAWSLPYAAGIKAYWLEDAAPVASSAVELSPSGRMQSLGIKPGVNGEKPTVAYLYRYESDA